MTRLQSEMGLEPASDALAKGAALSFEDAVGEAMGWLVSNEGFRPPEPAPRK
jgi:hypothetical protein